MLIGLLAVAFVLSGFRQATGFIVVEAWEIVTAMCLAARVSEVVRRRRICLELDVVGLFAVAVVAAAWLSYFGALDLTTWFKRAARITCLFGMYLFLVTYTPDERRFRAFLRCCLWACAATALVMLVQAGQWIRGGAELERLFAGGFRGTFANYNEGSTYVAMFAVLALASWMRPGSLSSMSGRFDAAACGLCLVAVVTGLSRTGVLAMLAGVTVVLVGERRIGICVGVAIGGVALFWIMSRWTHLASRWLAMFGASGDPELDAFIRGGTVVRIFLAQIYWLIIKARPIFGIGAANYGFMAQLPVHWPEIPAGASREFETLDPYIGYSSHNGFLNWWAETGTVGFLPFVGSLAYATWALGRVRRQHADPAESRTLALGTIGAISVFIVTNMAGDFGVSEARYWVLLAITSSVLRLSGPDHARYTLLQMGQRAGGRAGP